MIISFLYVYLLTESMSKLVILKLDFVFSWITFIISQINKLFCTVLYVIFSSILMNSSFIFFSHWFGFVIFNDSVMFSQKISSFLINIEDFYLMLNVTLRNMTLTKLNCSFNYINYIFIKCDSVLSLTYIKFPCPAF